MLTIPEHTRMSLFGISMFKLQSVLSKHGLMGKEYQNTCDFQSRLYLNPFQEDFNMSVMPKFYTISSNIEYIKSREAELRNFYLQHNQHVIDTVPSEDLLVWNVKEGWEPLCKFLKHPVPKEPIPHDNKTGTDWMSQYVWGSTYIKRMQHEYLYTILLNSVKISFLLIALLYASV